MIFPDRNSPLGRVTVATVIAAAVVLVATGVVDFLIRIGPCVRTTRQSVIRAVVMVVAAAGTYTAASTTSLAVRAGGLGAAAAVPCRLALAPADVTTIRSMRGLVTSAAGTVTLPAVTARSKPLVRTAALATATVISGEP